MLVDVCLMIVVFQQTQANDDLIIQSETYLKLNKKIFFEEKLILTEVRE